MIFIRRQGLAAPFLATLQSAGIATANMLPFSPLTVSSSASCASDRLDSTYPTVQSGNITNETNVFSLRFFGKFSHPSTMGRNRLGLSFPVPSAGTLIGATHVSLKLQFSAFGSTLGETWTPDLYLSATDDHAKYSSGTKSVYDWEGSRADGNLAIDGGYAYQGSFVYGTTGVQTMPLTYATIAAKAGTTISFVVGTNLDLSAAGVTTPSGSTLSEFDVPVGFTAQLFFS